MQSALLERGRRMGNVCSGGNAGSADEENNIAMSLADAAATGARNAVIEALQLQTLRQRQQDTSQGVLIGGMLPVARAQEAAAAGAERAVEAKAKELNFSSRFAFSLKQVKSSAAYGAKSGLQEVEKMAMLSDMEADSVKVISLDVAAAAAATGARIACFVAAQKNLSLNTSRYTAFLGPMLGGSFPSSAAIYNLIRGSSDFVKLCGFGGVTLAVFIISSGFAAGLLGRSARSACYTRFAALAAITIVLALFSLALCTLFDSIWYKATCGAICATLIMTFIIVWLVYRW